MKKILLALTMCAMFVVTGCNGTLAAYKAAGSVEDYAYVVTRHYEALQKEAIRLRGTGTLSGDNLAKVQAADQKATPVVVRLGELAQAYESVHDAKTAAELQTAVNDAVVVVASFSRLILENGGKIGAMPTRHFVAQRIDPIGLVPLYE